jgi:hypothetical protein
MTGRKKGPDCSGALAPVRKDASPQAPLMDAFAEMSAAQHLDTAKGFHPSTFGSSDQAKRHLAAIDKSSPEYKEAVQLNADLIKKEKALQKETEAQHAKAEIKANPLEVVKSSWEDAAFETVAIWRVTFKNRSSKPVGNIKYRTLYYSETGGLVDKGGVDTPLIAESKTVQKVIPPKGSRTIEINDCFVNKEANRAKFELVAWEFVI